MKLVIRSTPGSAESVTDAATHSGTNLPLEYSAYWNLLELAGRG